MFYVVAVRSSRQSLIQWGVWSNPRLTGAVVFGLLLQLAVVYAPPLQEIFHTVPLPAPWIAAAMATADSALVLVELVKWRRRAKGPVMQG